MKNYYYKKSVGLTLIELMIAITLGMLVISAVFFVFLEVKQSSRQNENFGRMQENARFALRAISYELSHAGFFAGMLKGADVAIDDTATAADNIGTDCGASGDTWITNLSTAIEYTASHSGSEPTEHDCINDLVDGTATLAIRSVANTSLLTETAGLIEADHTYIRTNGNIGCLWFADAADSEPTNIACPTVGSDVEDWEFKSTIYYVSNAGDIPTLCRKVVDQGNSVGVTTECLVEGVERFHIDFGIDPDANGRAESYTSATIDEDNVDEIVSARIYILVRSPDIDASYTNTKTYDLGSSSYNPVDDQYYRRVFSTTVLLRNIVNLRNF